MATPNLGSHDPLFIRRLTNRFTLGYFLLIFTLLGLGACLFYLPENALSKDQREVMIWIMGNLGILIGVLTDTVSSLNRYHISSSPGSKMKDEAKTAGV